MDLVSTALAFWFAKWVWPCCRIFDFGIWNIVYWIGLRFFFGFVVFKNWFRIAFLDLGFDISSLDLYFLSSFYFLGFISMKSYLSLLVFLWVWPSSPNHINSTYTNITLHYCVHNCTHPSPGPSWTVFCQSITCFAVIGTIGINPSYPDLNWSMLATALLPQNGPW